MDPLLADALGKPVLVRYLDTADHGGVGEVAGNLGLVEREGVITELAIEADGGTHFVPLARLITLTRED